MRHKVITFGEMLLRLKTPGYERFFQTQALEATFGGAESNVAVALCNYEMDASHVTAVPDNELGIAAIQELRRFGVDTRFIKKQGERLGTYYLEAGAAQRPSRVVYDRAYSSLAMAQPSDFDWEEIFKGATWFHTSGITPAISQSAADMSLEAMKAAKARGVTTSLDLNYRGKLWTYGKGPKDVMPALVEQADLVIAGREDCQKCLGIDSDIPAEEDIAQLDHFHDLADEFLKKFDSVSKLSITLRQSMSANYHRWSACLWDRDSKVVADIYKIKNIIDRVGGGDSFASGLIYGLTHYKTAQQALDFATAASCLKHSIPGDLNRVTASEVECLMAGDSTGRVQR
ncbi:sugar kinase [Temperatibacter marinus]|uniref:Sugar kinase n=1 Tax=Temperatibacter marinus TaxID=1456591 RepID=A0AA52EHR0_9PROT|nr:sugar kinase [Temperatibacter marinus]WND03868.1 sugar kinase [Temperatibacter marinus]